MYVQSSLSSGLNTISAIPQTPNVAVANKRDPQKEAVDDLTWKIQYLIAIFQEWVNKANEMTVDVNKQINKMVSVIQDHPININSDFQSEICLRYETTMLNIYSSQIIRKMAKAQIKRAAQSAREMPGLRHQIRLINDTERYLLKQLPAKQLPSIIPVENTIEQYTAIKSELERVMGQIYRKAKNL